MHRTLCFWRNHRRWHRHDRSRGCLRIYAGLADAADRRGRCCPGCPRMPMPDTDSPAASNRGHAAAPAAGPSHEARTSACWDDGRARAHSVAGAWHLNNYFALPNGRCRGSARVRFAERGQQSPCRAQADDFGDGTVGRMRSTPPRRLRLAVCGLRFAVCGLRLTVYGLPRFSSSASSLNGRPDAGALCGAALVRAPADAAGRASM